MHKQFVLVTYDVPNDRRRTRLHTILCNYGTPVQYSVFECLVTDAELAALQAELRRAIKPRLDDVRYYCLCSACQARIETTRAAAPVTQEAHVYIA